MKRTQLYIDEELFQWLLHISREKKTTVSDLVRNALNRVYGQKRKKTDKLKALNEAFGIWKNRKDISSTEEYIRTLRKNTRFQRFGLK